MNDNDVQKEAKRIVNLIIGIETVRLEIEPHDTLHMVLQKYNPALVNERGVDGTMTLDHSYLIETPEMLEIRTNDGDYEINPDTTILQDREHTNG